MHETGLPENNFTVNCTFDHNESIYTLHNEASHAMLSNVPNLLLLLRYCWCPSFLHNSIVCHFKSMLFSVLKKIIKVKKLIAMNIYCI